MGVTTADRRGPDATPATKLERSPAPACHSVLCARPRRFLAAYATFRDRYKQRLRASPQARHLRHHRERRRDHRQQYPPGALVRPRWYIPAPADLAATWLRGIDDADLALA
jgi:hypothetical protein